MEFDAPGNCGTREEATCPMCRTIAIPLPQTTADEDIGNSKAIPLRRKSLNIDLSDMIIRNANSKTPAGISKIDVFLKSKHIAQGSRVTDNVNPTVQLSSTRKYGKQRINWENDTKGKDSTQPETQAPDSNRRIKIKKLPQKKKLSTKARILYLLALSLMTIAVWMMPDRNRSNPRPKVSPADNAVEKDTPLIKESAVLTPIQQTFKKHGIRETHEQATAALRTFLGAGELSVRKSVTRAMKRVEPLMANYYASNDPGPIKYQTISDYTHSVITEKFLLLETTLHDFSKVTAIVVLEKGRFVVDWESFVGYSEMSLEEFMKEQPKKPTLFRVRIRFDDYFNFDFTDINYKCLHMSDLKQTDVIYGYIHSESELFSTLQQGEEGFFIVRIRYPEHPKTTNQVLIDEVVTNGWLYK